MTDIGRISQITTFRVTVNSGPETVVAFRDASISSEACLRNRQKPAAPI